MKKDKHATTIIGEYTIPLIGIPPDATQMECEKCKSKIHISTAVLGMDGKVRCPPCAEKEKGQL